MDSILREQAWIRPNQIASGLSNFPRSVHKQEMILFEKIGYFLLIFDFDRLLSFQFDNFDKREGACDDENLAGFGLFQNLLDVINPPFFAR